MSYTSPIDEKEYNQNEDDRISHLGDDVLISILFLLNLKDATITSILSRSWRYLSTYFTSLEFDGSKRLDVHCIYKDPSLSNQKLRFEKLRFVSWVNQVVHLNRALVIDDFIVRFALSSAQADHIDRWVQFAISKKVQSLELDFTCSLSFAGDDPTTRYSLPCYIFKEPSYESHITVLRSLCLKYVNISGEIIELLLSRCHVLERLYAVGSDDLVNVRVINLSGSLKHLALSGCFNLKQVEVHAVNLVSFEFKCYNGRANVLYGSVPSLVEASFGGCYWNEVLPNFWQPITSISAQLSKLCLNIFRFGIDFIVPSFKNVKRLELRVYVTYVGHLYTMTTRLGEACPFLQEFKLEVIWSSSQKEEDEEEGEENEEADSESDSTIETYSDSDSEAYALEDVQHWLEQHEDVSCGIFPNLHKLEWIGAFRKRVDDDISLTLYIVKNAIMLKKIVCNPCDPFKVGTSSEFRDKVLMETARRHARRLAMVLPKHIDLVIL